MKKVLSLALVFALVLVFASCGKGDTSSLESESTNSSEGFAKPDKYATVLLVTINPQFRLYLDENEIVLAVEAVNQDAESLKYDISFENESFETVIENIVTLAQNNGFIKEDATVSIEISESNATDTAKADILAKAEKTVNDTADELKIKITVSVGENVNLETDSSEADPDSNPVSSMPASSQSSSKANQSSSISEHTHSFSEATCTEPKKCSCGAKEGSALGHDYKDGVCTRCGAKDPNFKFTSVLTKQGEWSFKYLDKEELYSISMVICKSGKNHVDVGLGDLLSKLPPDMQNDANIKEYCEQYNGKDYYIGRGDGDDLKSVTEEDKTATVTDSSGNKLVLTRTGENTLKYTSGSLNVLSSLPSGAEFTFVAG